MQQSDPETIKVAYHYDWTSKRRSRVSANGRTKLYEWYGKYEWYYYYGRNYFYGRHYDSWNFYDRDYFGWIYLWHGWRHDGNNYRQCWFYW